MIFPHPCWQKNAWVPHRGPEFNRIMLLISVSTKLLFRVDGNGLGRVRNETTIRSEGEIPDLENFPTYKFWPLTYFSFDLIDTRGGKGWCRPRFLSPSDLALGTGCDGACSLKFERKEGRSSKHCYKWPCALRVHSPVGPQPWVGRCRGISCKICNAEQPVCCRTPYFTYFF
uniref:Uncharacterized protein n=1 Tax=Pipistrellus kuhlii TaxID=59472 RepID=A0A7J7TL88_PIPKU|nr:hypothetical protein mPipKuh1_009359 [Pipistrellus kuhlii]